MGRAWVMVLAALLLSSSVATADVVITLDPRDPVIGEIVPGTRLEVDVLLSVNDEDNPLADVRLIEFDFAGSDSSLQLESFTWNVSEVGYGFRMTNLPRPNATSFLVSSSSLLLNLTTEPVVVGTLELVANLSGTLDAGTTTDHGALISADFSNPREFSPDDGNLQGGQIEIVVTGDGGGADGGGGDDGGGDDGGSDDGSGGGNDGGDDGSGDDGSDDGTDPPVDTDEDGVPDDVDDFPEDPSESVDTDGDMVGDQADTDNDNDGVLDDEDDFPQDSGETSDVDDDGVGDNTDDFPMNPNETTDSDQDGVGDQSDAFPLDPTKTDPDDDSGPRAAGGFCAMGSLSGMFGILAGLSFLSLRRRGFR